MSFPPTEPGRRYTARRAWAPMTDAEWAEILPHLRTVAMGEGRPLRDARHRIDGMFRIAVSGEPWRSLPEDYGKPDTVSRHFRRLAHMGLWMRLVGACSNQQAAPALRRIEYFICRAARRAMRILGLDAAVRAETVGLLTAMPVLPVYLTRPHFCEQVRTSMLQVMLAHRACPLTLPVAELRGWLRLHRHFAGKPWHRRWAPP